MLACTQTLRRQTHTLGKKAAATATTGILSQALLSRTQSHMFDSERVCFEFFLLEAKNSAGIVEQYTSYKGQTHNTMTNARLGCVAY